jgi:hypothetical protein
MNRKMRKARKKAEKRKAVAAVAADPKYDDDHYIEKVRLGDQGS